MTEREIQHHMEIVRTLDGDPPAAAIDRAAATAAKLTDAIHQLDLSLRRLTTALESVAGRL